MVTDTQRVTLRNMKISFIYKFPIMNVKCENPQIILHPYTKDRILKYGNYTIRNITKHLTNYELSRLYNYFPTKLIHPKALKIESSEIDSCYVIDDTGVLLPMYLIVPCGKCMLCKSKKVLDWQCRALCEASTSITKPLWIGLSYNDRLIPKNGVSKSDAQNFLKRLRIRLDRAGYTHDLKYFLCSEYGEDNNRCHYHILLFNFPDMEDQQKYLIIRDAWSKVVSLSEWSTFPEYSRFVHWKLKPEYETPKYHKIVNNLFLNNMYVDMKKYCKSIRYHVRIGFIYYDSLDGIDGLYRVKYCMKYMYKDSKIPIEVLGKYSIRRKFKTVREVNDDYFGISYIENIKVKYGNKVKVRLIRKKYNDTFYLASRNLAIGKQWFLEHLKEYEKNIKLTDVSVRAFGQVLTFPLPRYFKNILFPSVSRLVPKEVRDKVKEYNRVLFDIYKNSYRYTNRTIPYYSDDAKIMEKFKCLHWFIRFKINSSHRYSNLSESFYRYDEYKKYQELYNYLKNVDIDSDYIINIQSRKEVFNQILIDINKYKPDIPIVELVNKHKKRRLSEKIKKKKLYMSEFNY